MGNKYTAIIYVAWKMSQMIKKGEEQKMLSISVPECLKETIWWEEEHNKYS